MKWISYSSVRTMWLQFGVLLWYHSSPRIQGPATLPALKSLNQCTIFITNAFLPFSRSTKPNTKTIVNQLLIEKGKSEAGKWFIYQKELHALCTKTVALSRGHSSTAGASTELWHLPSLCRIEFLPKFLCKYIGELKFKVPREMWSFYRESLGRMLMW